MNVKKTMLRFYDWQDRAEPLVMETQEQVHVRYDGLWLDGARPRVLAYYTNAENPERAEEDGWYVHLNVLTPGDEGLQGPFSDIVIEPVYD